MLHLSIRENQGLIINLFDLSRSLRKKSFIA